MGLLTLPDFVDELELALGDVPGLSSGQTERWINFGYLELATGVDFEALDDDFTFPTVAAQQAYTGPSEPLAVKIVRNEDQDYNLDWTGKEDLLRRPTGTGGPPEVWTRHKEDILLWPVPLSVDSFRVVYKKTPAPLSGTDATVLPAQWDLAVVMFAASYGYHSLAMADRAVAWFNRGVAYVNSRMTEQSIHEGTAGLGMAQASFNPETE